MLHAARNALASPHTGQYCFPQPGMYCMEYTACQYAEERRCRTASPRGQAERESRYGQTEHAPTAYPRSHPTPSNQGIEALPACKRGLAKAELSQGFSTGKLKLHENAISSEARLREKAQEENLKQATEQETPEKT